MDLEKMNPSVWSGGGRPDDTREKLTQLAAPSNDENPQPLFVAHITDFTLVK